MRTFKQYLLESNISFDTSDISSDAKKLGRAAICRIADISTATLKKMQPYIGKKANSPSQIMTEYNAFVEAFPTEAKLISNNRGTQVGPGEMVFYFVFDNIGVGGNQNIDLFLDDKPFAEVKAGPVSADKKSISGFEFGSNAAGTGNKLVNALTNINDAYSGANGEDLPGWRGGDSVKSSDLKSWIDLEVSVGSSISLSLKSDGDLMKKGEKKPILNVNKAKTVAPIKKLLDEPSEESDVKSVSDAISEWSQMVYNNYAKDKLFFFVESKKAPKVVYQGFVTPEMIDLYRITRSKPDVIIRFNTKTSTKEESEE